MTEHNNHVSMGENDYTKELQRSMDMRINSNWRLMAWDGNKCGSGPEGRYGGTNVGDAALQGDAYTRCSADCAEKENVKLIDPKWIDSNKWYVANPNYR